MNRIFPAGLNRPMDRGKLKSRPGTPFIKEAWSGTVSPLGSILRRRSPMWFCARKFGSGSGANTEGKYRFIAVFFKKGHFKRIQTVQFSGLPFCAKRTLPAVCRAGPGLAGARYGRKINGVPGRGKRRSFSNGKDGELRLAEPGGGHREGPFREMRFRSRYFSRRGLDSLWH